MPITFDNEEAAYHAWCDANPSGWVVNRRREPDTSYLLLHRPGCWHIRRDPKGNFTVNEYVKVCALDFAGLLCWSAMVTRRQPEPCGTCIRDGLPEPLG
jgi:hypothetical protein